MDEKELIIKILKGDTKSFELIIKKYEKIIFSIISSRIKNYNDSKDLTQEVFILIYDKLHLFDLEKSFFSWIYKITINKVNEYFRKNKNKSKEIDIFESEKLNFLNNENFISKDDKIDLFNALDKLKDKERDILIMKYFLDYDINEISEIFNMTESNVKVFLMRAREKLLKILEG